MINAVIILQGSAKEPFFSRYLYRATGQWPQFVAVFPVISRCYLGWHSGPNGWSFKEIDFYDFGKAWTFWGIRGSAQGWAKEWSPGCENPASWFPLAASSRNLRTTLLPSPLLWLPLNMKVWIPCQFDYIGYYCNISSLLKVDIFPES